MSTKSKSNQPEELLTLSQVSRKLDVPYSRVLRLAHDGEIEPDFVTRSLPLIRLTRLDEIRAITDQR